MANHAPPTRHRASRVTTCSALSVTPTGTSTRYVTSMSGPPAASSAFGSHQTSRGSEKRLIQGIVIWHVDRLFRQPRDLERLIDLADTGFLVAGRTAPATCRTQMIGSFFGVGEVVGFFGDTL